MLVQFPGGGCWEPCLEYWVFYLFWPAGGGSSRFASRHFPTPAILASWILAGRLLGTCYACSPLFLFFFLFNRPSITVFWTVTVFVLIFWQLVILRIQWNSPDLFFLNSSFHYRKLLCSMSTSIVLVFEKIDVKVRLRIGPNFKFGAVVALLC